MRAGHGVCGVGVEGGDSGGARRERNGRSKPLYPTRHPPFASRPARAHAHLKQPGTVAVERLPGDDGRAPRVLRQPAAHVQHHALHHQPHAALGRGAPHVGLDGGVSQRQVHGFGGCEVGAGARAT